MNCPTCESEMEDYPLLWHEYAHHHCPNCGTMVRRLSKDKTANEPIVPKLTQAVMDEQSDKYGDTPGKIGEYDRVCSFLVKWFNLKRGE